MVKSYGTEGSAISKYVQRVEIPQGAPLTVFILHPWCKRPQVLEVSAELRERFPNTTISAIGGEVAVFARDEGLSASNFAGWSQRP